MSVLLFTSHHQHLFLPAGQCLIGLLAPSLTTRDLGKILLPLSCLPFGTFLGSSVRLVLSLGSSAMRRRRFRRRPRRSRRRHGRARRRVVGVRRNRTKVVSAVYDSENVCGGVMIPGNSSFYPPGAGGPSGTYVYASVLPSYQSASGNQAAAYFFMFNLASCYACNFSYQTVAALYDFFKLVKVQLTLKCPIDPRRDIAMPIGNSGTQYDFTGSLVYDPDMTVVDYDGITLSRTLPGNGDGTQIVYDRSGVRKHKAFGTIRRTFYPRVLDMHPLCGVTGGVISNCAAYPNYVLSSGGPLVQVGLSRGRRYGWCTTSQDAQFTGSFGLFSSYKGPNSPGGGIQPAYNWGIQTKWFVKYRDTIYG